MPPTCRHSNVNNVADTGNLRVMKRGTGTPLQLHRCFCILSEKKYSYFVPFMFTYKFTIELRVYSWTVNYNK